MGLLCHPLHAIYYPTLLKTSFVCHRFETDRTDQTELSCLLILLSRAHSYLLQALLGALGGGLDMPGAAGPLGRQSLQLQ